MWKFNMNYLRGANRHTWPLNGSPLPDSDGKQQKTNRQGGQ